MNLNQMMKGNNRAFANENSRIIDGIDKDEARVENKSFAFNADGLKNRAKKAYSKLGDSEGMQNFKNADATAKAYKEGKYFENQAGSLGSNFLFKIAGMAGLQQELVMGLAPVVTNAIEQTNNPLMKKFLGTTFGGLLQAQEANRLGERKKLVNNILEMFKPMAKAGKLAFDGIAVTAQFIKDKTVEASTLVVNSMDDFISNALSNTGFLAPLLKVMYPFIKSTFMSITKASWNLGSMLLKKTGSFLFGSLISKFFKTNKTVENAAKDRLQIIDTIKLVSGGLDFANKHLGLQSSKLDAINDTLKSFTGENSNPFSFKATKEKFFSGSTRDMSDSSADSYATDNKSKLHDNLDQDDVENTFDGMDGAENVPKKKKGFFTFKKILGGLALGGAGAAIYAHNKNKKSKETEPVAEVNVKSEEIEPIAEVDKESKQVDEVSKEENRGFFSRILGSIDSLQKSTDKGIELETKQVDIAQDTLDEEKKQNQVNMSEQILDRRKKEKHDKEMLNALKGQKGKNSAASIDKEGSIFKNLFSNIKDNFMKFLTGGLLAGAALLLGPSIANAIGGLIEDSFNKVKNNLLEKILGVSATNTDGTDRAFSNMIKEALFGTSENPTKLGSIAEFVGVKLDSDKDVGFQIDENGNRKSQNELGFTEYALGGATAYGLYKARKPLGWLVNKLSDVSTGISNLAAGAINKRKGKNPSGVKAEVDSKSKVKDTSGVKAEVDSKSKVKDTSGVKAEVDNKSKVNKPAKKAPSKKPRFGKKALILSTLVGLGLVSQAKADDLEVNASEDEVQKINDEFMGVEKADNSISADNLIQATTAGGAGYAIYKSVKSPNTNVNSKVINQTIVPDSKMKWSAEAPSGLTKTPLVTVDKVVDKIPEKKGFFSSLGDKVKSATVNAYETSKKYVGAKYDIASKAVGEYIDDSPMLKKGAAYVNSKVEVAKKYGARVVSKALDSKWGKIAKTIWKIVTKIGSKFIPFVGWALAAYDITTAAMDVWENYENIMKSQGLDPKDYDKNIAKIALVIGKAFWGDELGAIFIKAYGWVRDVFVKDPISAKNLSSKLQPGPSEDLPSENAIRDELTTNAAPTVDSNVSNDLTLDANNPLSSLIPEPGKDAATGEWANFNKNLDIILGMKGNNHDGRGDKPKFAGPTGNNKYSTENYSLVATRESDILAGRDGNMQSGVSKRYRRSDLNDSDAGGGAYTYRGVELERAAAVQNYRRDVGYSQIEYDAKYANSDTSFSNIDTKLYQQETPQVSSSTFDKLISRHIRKWETGKAEGNYSVAKDIGDGAGISFGAYQLTEKSGGIRKYLSEISKINGDLTAKNLLSNFRSGWYKGSKSDLVKYLKESGNTPLGRSVQDKLYSQLYLEPGKLAARNAGLTDPASMAQYVDHYLNAGPTGAQRMLSRAKGLDPQSIANARVEHYNAIANANSDKKKFLKGWRDRVVGNSKLFNKNNIDSVAKNDKSAITGSGIQPSGETPVITSVAPESKIFASANTPTKGTANLAANETTESLVSGDLAVEDIRTSNTQQDNILQENVIATTNAAAIKEESKEKASLSMQKTMNNSLANVAGTLGKVNGTSTNTATNNVVAPVVVASTTNYNNSSATSVSGQHTAYRSTGNDISSR